MFYFYKTKTSFTSEYTLGISVTRQSEGQLVEYIGKTTKHTNGSSLARQSGSSLHISTMERRREENTY